MMSLASIYQDEIKADAVTLGRRGRIAQFRLGYAVKLRWSESDLQLVTVDGTPGLLLRHPIAGDTPRVSHRRRMYSRDLCPDLLRVVQRVDKPLVNVTARIHASR